MKKIISILSVILALSAVSYSADFAYEPSNEAKLEYNRGVDFYHASQYDKSMASFRRAIELDPNYVDAYYNLGLILEYLKQDEAALSIFKQIIVRKPDDYDSLYKAAFLSNKLGQDDNAKKYLSLIPVESPIYMKAQTLATSMSTDMQTIKADSQKSDLKVDQTNGMYNDLPSPTGIAGDKNGNIYVACFSDNLIYKITPDNKRILYVKNSKINGPIAMVSDELDNLYISNYNADNVIKVTPAGEISILISNIQKPYGMSIVDNMLFISSQGSNSVLRYKL